MRFHKLNITDEELVQVTEWVVNWNKLEEVPDLVQNMPNLESLNLEGNRISRLPDWLKDCDSLKKLELGANRFEGTDDLKNLPSGLTRLSLYHNNIGEIPISVTKLRNLEELNMSYTELTKLPAGIQNLKKLRVLELYGNKIRTLPVAIGKIPRLRELIVGENQISKIPDAIGNCRKLSKLFAGDNRIKTVSKALGNCTELSSLDLRNNKIAELPDSLGNCFTLQHLYLQGNQFNSIPGFVYRLKWMSKLLLRNNNLKKIDFGEGGDRLRFLDLSDNQIRTIVDLPKSLEVLYLLNNQLEEFPKAVLRCTGLRMLHLNLNDIKEIPEDLGPLKRSLKMLNLEKNPVRVNPEKLLHLETLEGFSGLVKKDQVPMVIAVIKACRNGLISREEGPVFLELLWNNKFEAKQLSTESLVNFLNDSDPVVAQKVRKFIFRKLGIPFYRKKLKKGHNLSVLGETLFDMTRLTERLKSFGVGVSKGVNEKTTHILLGKGPVKWPGDVKKGMVFLDEKKLSRELWRMEEAHLMNQSDSKVIRSVLDLLMSKDTVNVKLGLELMNGGGVPDELLNILLIVWLSGEQSSRPLEKELFRLIHLNVEDEWKFVLDRYKPFKIKSYLRREKLPERYRNRKVVKTEWKEIGLFFKKNKLDVELIKKALSIK